MFSVRALLPAIAAASISIAFGQSSAKTDALATEGYIRPPREVEDAALAPWYQNVSVTNISPDHRKYVVIERDGMPTLAMLGKDHVNLGGLQVDIAADRARDLTVRSGARIRIADFGRSKSIVVPLRPDARVTDVVWSHDAQRIAFLAHFLDRTEIWTADAETGRCRPATSWPVLATTVTSLFWTNDGRIVSVLVPKNRAARPERPDVATTPKVKVSDGKVTAIRTYPSLLQNPYEEELLEYYTTGQLAVIDIEAGHVKSIGKPAMIRSVDPSPDGKYFHVTVMERPFSYTFPVSSFGQREAIWDDAGKERALIQHRSLQSEDASAGAARGRGRGANSRRSLSWRPDGSGLSYIRTQPAPAQPADDEAWADDEQGRRGGAGRAPGTGSATAGPTRPDEVIHWLPPFDERDVHVIFTTPTRIDSLSYSGDMKSIFVGQTVAGKERTSIIRLDNPTHPVALAEIGTDDDPISLATKAGPKTGSVVRTTSDGRFAYLTGTKTSKDPTKEAPRPYVDKVDLTTGKRETVFESKADVFEQPSLLDDDFRSILVIRQSSKMVPNTYLLSPGSTSETALTSNKDYVPDLTQARRETITVTRQDGFKFEVKVTLPKYFTYGAKPPAFFWFYPSEFVNQDAYNKGKRSFNKNLFQQIGGSNKAILTRLGYTLVEPDCPIVGPGDRKNDEYVPQLRNNLAATIDELDKRGWIDRSRLGIGGHSYGAFSTANALVNTPFFKAGIAGDGNYNRTLTPFGFQTDDRELWDGRGFYLEMSPFLFAERMTGALLMYHGMEDQNVGTDPINSERMFDALEALGKHAALYKYPYEDHGQVARETILDQWARFVAWLDKYVKGG
ncbi:MAG: prolyl oligopeptidase family serine peptidase [Fimbriimonas sp.]|nr:prolyl oligopeptidase family serine peptidase [Fimbriimonas sp.]